METTTQVHTYDVSLNWENKTGNGIATSGVRTPLLFGPPPEFGGAENTWSPEHLLATSVAACYTTTFLHFARLLKVSLLNFSISCKVEFTKQEIGFEATRYHLQPVVKLDHNPGQNILDSLFAKAKKYCFISNSVKGEIEIKPIILNR
jgi:organic hydroperoxide reductase OsmC/OhrA